MPNENAQPKPAPPLVSVIIPAYNAAAHIAEAVNSVLAQSFTDLEIILINDGSPDTEEMELAIAPWLSSVLYLKQQNRGPSSARNLGIRHAQGEFLAFLDSDDAWLPQYLAEQLRFLHSDPALDMVFCDASLEGNAKVAGKTYMQICPSTGPVTFESVLLEKVQPLTSAMLVRRRKVIEAGLFDEKLRCSEDHDLWLRILHAGGRMAYQRRILLRRKILSDSQGSSSASLWAGEIQSLRKLDRSLDLSTRTRDLLRGRLQEQQAGMAAIEGKASLLAGELDNAQASLRRACALGPTLKLRAVLIGLRTAPHFTVLGARLWDRLTR